MRLIPIGPPLLEEAFFQNPGGWLCRNAGRLAWGLNAKLNFLGTVGGFRDVADSHLVAAPRLCLNRVVHSVWYLAINTFSEDSPESVGQQILGALNYLLTVLMSA